MGVTFYMNLSVQAISFSFKVNVQIISWLTLSGMHHNYYSVPFVTTVHVTKSLKASFLLCLY